MANGPMLGKVWIKAEITIRLNAKHVINAFGGLTATARALGIKSVSKVQSWQDSPSGMIPSQYTDAILEAGRANGIYFVWEEPKSATPQPRERTYVDLCECQG